MTGLSKSKAKDMSYSSTSHYLRQLVGTEKNRGHKVDPACKLISVCFVAQVIISHCYTISEPRTVCSVRAAPGTPAYKSPEEYYDEIMDLKKVHFPVT